MKSASNGSKKKRSCKLCGHKWSGRPEPVPRECPACHSRRWNRPVPPPLPDEVQEELERAIYKALRLRYRRSKGNPKRASSHSNHRATIYTTQ